MAAVDFHNAVDYGQAQAGATASGGVERLEDLGLYIRGDANP